MASLLDRWLDGVEEGWGIPLLLAIFVVLWTAFLALAYQNADLHPDVIEAWTIGRTLDWSGAKHPPLMGWVTHIWTLLFPVRDWSFHLLAMVNATIALWIIDLTARRFVSGDKRAIILLLLMLLLLLYFGLNMLGLRIDAWFAAAGAFGELAQGAVFLVAAL